MQGVWVWSLVGELRSHVWPKNQTIKKKQNRSNIATNSIKTLKMVHIKKIKINRNKTQLLSSELWTSFFRNNRNMDSGKTQHNPVDRDITFFGAKAYGICGGPCRVCAPLTIGTQWLRPLPHSPPQIRTPHLLREREVWASKPPFCPCPVVLLGSYFFDNPSGVASLLCASSSSGLFLVSVVLPEVTPLESVCWTWWRGLLRHCRHDLGKDDGRRKEEDLRSESGDFITRRENSEGSRARLLFQLLHSPFSSAWFSLSEVAAPRWGVVEAIDAVWEINRNARKPARPARLSQGSEGVFLTKSDPLAVKHKKMLCVVKDQL